jgi:hypothetical protein
MRYFAPLLLVLLTEAGIARPADPAADVLKLLISTEQLTVTAPYPARLTLHLHNSGRAPLWLYRRVRSETREGSSLEARLEPIRATASPEISAPAPGRVLESVGLPQPKLVSLAPGDDYTEKTTLKVVPARSGTHGEGTPLWGRYRLAVTYRATYSNAAEIERVLGVELWQGEVTSNTIEIELQPPVGEGSVAGTVLAAQGRGVYGTLVSLTDPEDRLVDQLLTDSEGRFSFTHLPLGVDYWVTARRPELSEDTAVFRHLSLTPAAPAGTIEFVLLPKEIYEPQYLLHKPVLLRVMDSSGRPLSRAPLEVIWSSGTVLDNVKGETLEDGTVALELLPGRNFATLKRRGCPKEDHRVDVASGSGIDAFKLTSECAKE